MKRVRAIAAGVVMMLAAAFLAANSTNQEAAPQPEVARQFATALRETPTRVPTVVPTMTPIRDGADFIVANVKLRLPETFDSVLLLQTTTDASSQSGGLVSGRM